MIRQESFGEYTLFTLSNEELRLAVTDLGATAVSLRAQSSSWISPASGSQTSRRNISGHLQTTSETSLRIAQLYALVSSSVSSLVAMRPYLRWRFSAKFIRK